MLTFKPIHALLVLCAISVSGLARSAVTLFEPVFIDPGTLYDVGSNDPDMYHWSIDPTIPTQSSWGITGSGVDSYANAALWVSQTLTQANSSATATNSGTPLFALTAGASAPVGTTLPTMCIVKVHMYAIMQATASAVGAATATAHAQVGSAYLDDTNSVTVDLGTRYVTVILNEFDANQQQPTVIGNVAFSAQDLLALCTSTVGDPVSDNSASATAQIQYKVDSWTYRYPPAPHPIH